MVQGKTSSTHHRPTPRRSVVGAEAITSDETRQAHDRPGPTHNKPTRGRLAMGAEVTGFYVN